MVATRPSSSTAMVDRDTMLRRMMYLPWFLTTSIAAGGAGRTVLYDVEWEEEA